MKATRDFALARAFGRLHDLRTQGWEEGQTADAAFGCPELSDPAWDTEWQEVWERTAVDIATAFKVEPAVVNEVVQFQMYEQERRYFFQRVN